MAEFIFWYFVVGVALIFLYGITTITGMFLKYPVNDVSEAIDRVHKEYCVSSNNIVEGIWQFIIGCVLAHKIIRRTRNNGTGMG